MSQKNLLIACTCAASLLLSTAALVAALGLRPAQAPNHALKTIELKTPSEAGQRAALLTPDNTTLGWACGKSSPTGTREDHHGAWGSYKGQILFDHQKKRLAKLELTFATDSLTADIPTLRDTVINEQWFDTKTCPEATFVLSDDRVGATDAQRLLHGTFTLNDIAKELDIPATITYAGDGLTLEANFTISRKDFKVEKRDFSLAGTAAAVFTVDDAVKIKALVELAPTMGVGGGGAGRDKQARSEIEEIKSKELTQKKLNEQFLGYGPGIDDLQERLTRAELVLNLLKRDIGTSATPASFNDKVPYDTSALGPVPFRMILVPGDPAKGVAPFYIGETEVTWEMFKPFSHWEDKEVKDHVDTRGMSDEERKAYQKEKSNKELALCESECKMRLRPSNIAPYRSPDGVGGQGYVGRPACGMSRLSAEKFCLWLSKETGRNYRLPTEAEWERAYQLGGGDQGHPVENACNVSNSFDTDIAFKAFSRPVAKGSPDKLGLYDMLGNVAEWVKTNGTATANGKNTFVRGGHFLTPQDQLAASVREESSTDIWNEHYPQQPKSQWWFVDAGFVGFRLVCDPFNIPKN